MKKYIIPLILLIMLFVGCKNPNNDEVVVFTESNADSILSTEEIESIPNIALNSNPVFKDYNAPTNSGNIEEPISVSFYSFEEFEDYIEKNNLENVIVPYDDIKIIGNFDSFVFLSDAFHGDYSRYFYGLVDESGRRLMLKIEPLNMTQRLNDIEIELDKTVRNDMRKTSYIDTDFSGGYYTTGMGVEFWYFNYTGKLASINWYTNALHYSISSGGSYGFADYPLDSNTFVAKALNLDTAVNTISQLKDSLVAQKSATEKE